MSIFAFWKKKSGLITLVAVLTAALSASLLFWQNVFNAAEMQRLQQAKKLANQTLTLIKSNVALAEQSLIHLQEETVLRREGAELAAAGRTNEALEKYMVARKKLANSLALLNKTTWEREYAALKELGSTLDPRTLELIEYTKEEGRLRQFIADKQRVMENIQKTLVELDALIQETRGR